MRSIRQYLPAGLFFAALLMPALSCLYSPALKPFLLTRLHGGDTSTLEEEVRRTNPLWTGALQLYSTTLYRFGISSNPNAARIGLDGWVFLGNEHNENFAQAIRQRVISNDDASHWGEVLDDQRAWLKSQGIPSVFVFAPMKANIYPEKLPRWAQVMRYGKPSIFDMLQRHTGDELLDLRHALIQNKQYGLTYSMLNSHWSDYGAYSAWQVVAKRLEKDISGFKAYGTGPVVKINRTTYGNEFDAMVNIHVDNAWDVYSLAQPQPDIEMQQADGTWSSLHGDPATDVLDLPRHTRNPSATNNLKALVLRDSMGNSLSPFLQGSFKETFQEHHHFFPGYSLNLPQLIETKKPDVVIYVMTERFDIEPLGNLYYWRSERNYRESKADILPLKVTAGGSRVSLDTAFVLNDGITKGGVLHLRLRSKSDTYVHLAYGAERARNEFYETVTRGWNDLYFELPARPGNGVIDLTSPDGNVAEIQQADFKPAG
ncbi:alginate O-acetyltransferase AlgX-related protein [Caballeronia sordidicola]|uniref:AlgX/AlgJ SGNH hydrolase-like domain-containing protein n=1 Tax=Caballeronia sordidicola TaxID=196367 RepID=A0A226X4J8_CABSO|nr:hypothetical protein [Caballeronia sordidicola]OXC77917.1 hypothetical protein BSU04_14620 [Caballeronia sordidicola]